MTFPASIQNYYGNRSIQIS